MITKVCVIFSKNPLDYFFKGCIFLLSTTPRKQRGLKIMFTIRNLSVLSYAQGFTSWLYRHNGDISEVFADGFFDSANDMMSKGDMIMISAKDSGAHRFVLKSDKSGVVITKLV